ncbi:hypothetical protein I553_2455 [Mycobacterium xenopi 4042]|uniref:Uncharacterized protein n=1 Tax=Mycobacterium xenopi 4042 TaxID=1299334 RepID=X8C879_MYCXE|nr:hypothetical protein I553_2455 [Mycobacterium xenopi 4042]
MDGVDLPATFTDVDGHVIPGPSKLLICIWDGVRPSCP